MVKDSNESTRKPIFHIIGLIWILIETNLLSGNIFGFGSMFSVLPRYGIYESRCETPSEKHVSNDTIIMTKDCRGQVDAYQLAFALGIGFYNLPAALIGMVIDYFGARTLKLIGIIFHLIGWLSLGFIKPGYDWLLVFHTIFTSLAGMCVLLTSFTISANFTKTRGLVASLVCGAQLASCIWYAIFQMVIDKQWVSLSTLSFIWASFGILMFGSSMLFFNWRFTLPNKSAKSTRPKKDDVVVNASEDSLVRHITNPIFIMVTCFLSCLLLTVVFLPVVWFPWVMHLTRFNLNLSNFLTFLFNMSATLSIFIAPICGIIIDYKAMRGYFQRLFNVSLMQTLTWIVTMLLCFVCMIRSIVIPIIVICIFIFSRTMLITGCQAVITTIFPPRYIGTLLGVMWTVVGIVSFASYGLVRLARNPLDVWRPWLVIALLCGLMIVHLIQLWNLYMKSKKDAKNQSTINEEQMEALKSSTEN